MREQSWTCHAMHCNCICLEFYGVEAFRIPLVGERMYEFGVGCIFLFPEHMHTIVLNTHTCVYTFYTEKRLRP